MKVNFGLFFCAKLLFEMQQNVNVISGWVDMSKTPAHHKLPWIAAAIARAKAVKKDVKPLLFRVGDRFSLRVGITVFGSPSYFSLDEAISEFKDFVEQNSKFRFNIVLNNYGPLGLESII